MAACAAEEMHEEGEVWSNTGGEPEVVTPQRGLVETEKFLAKEFISEDLYVKTYQALASRWDRLHSLSAAMKLMEEYGVKLTPEEEQRLSGMDEGQQINALVMKMPQQSNEQFQQFFLQLQLLVSTATRVRRSLEDGRPDLVEDALNDAECTGISQYILRMAIVQAGSEVALLREQYHAWLKEVDFKCGKLIRGQEDCRTAQMRLAAAQAQLANFQEGQNESVKKVMMNFAAQTDKGLISSTFSGWRTWTKQEKLEKEIAGEYRDKLEVAVRRLAEVKDKQLGNARGMMMRKAMANDENLRTEIFRTWRDEVKESVEKAANAHIVAELEQKLSNMKSSQMDNTKKVMMRMNADSMYALLGQTFQAFVTFHKDYQKNKDFEDQVKKSEAQVGKFMKEKSSGARKVLEKMGGGTDTGLVQQCYKAWQDTWADAKAEAELEAKINDENSKLANFGSKSKDSGMSAMDRARHHLEAGLLLRIFGSWRLDARMEATLKTYHAKIEAKRGQLVGVQHMFRRFANELENSFRASQDTTRDFRDGPPPGRKLNHSQERRLSKGGDGATSLPDISKPGSGRLQDVSKPGSGRQQDCKPGSGRPQKPSTPGSQKDYKPGSGRPQKPSTPGSQKVRTPTSFSPSA